jgi:adenylate cyclase
MERKLAAILAADVVGYSALMAADEAGTFARLRADRRELFGPEIKKHHGRIFKLMGDGLLAEFGSVVDAVECAVTLQRGMAERNASVPESKHIEVRIGINLGEVIVEGEDRYGDGVNVAARLQQLAEPGGICVSGKVSKEVEKKLAFGFEPMGEPPDEEYRRTDSLLSCDPAILAAGSARPVLVDPTQVAKQGCNCGSAVHQHE